LTAAVLFQMTNIADLLKLCDLQSVVRDLCPTLYIQLILTLFFAKEGIIPNLIFYRKYIHKRTKHLLL
jgi:hypothetical protein